MAKPNRKDTVIGPPLRILSLDGGGVRGYSMLIILQELMHRTFVELEGRPPKKHEIPKPCDHFDLIVGTGTGGIIALMLGRLRLSIDVCKDVYIRMTRRVFETDKTIAGIPYRSTLFKASKLEEAIRECVQQHTIFSDEGNDDEHGPLSTDPPPPGSGRRPMARATSVSSRYSQYGVSTLDIKSFQSWTGLRGDPAAQLYDNREKRTKTAVTAMYKGSRPGSLPALLRSYDSRKESAVEENTTIWEAGRATAAVNLAFKPIKIGQSLFLDDGHGKYNPAPIALDEAVVNEWPGREIGVFISIGTGKRPNGTNNIQHQWWESVVGSSMGEFAEARRRLIAKIEACETTHQEMLRGRLADRGVNIEHYYRLNVEVGVGEFGMSEWSHLSEISTSTRIYLANTNVQGMNISAATKLARIEKHRVRWLRGISTGQEVDPGIPRHSWELSDMSENEPEPPAVFGAVELPAEEVPDDYRHSMTGSHVSGVSSVQTLPYPVTPTSNHASVSVINLPGRPMIRPPPSQQSSNQNSSGPQLPSIPQQSRIDLSLSSADDDKFVVHAPEPATYNAGLRSSLDQTPPSINISSCSPAPNSRISPPRPLISNNPPPLPPKTPLTSPNRPATSPYGQIQNLSSHSSHPAHPSGPSRSPRPFTSNYGQYPDDIDQPPPLVNNARKPEFWRK